MKEFAITLEQESGIPLYEQIYKAIREAILAGRIPCGEKLPSTRFQAEYLQVSRSTVELAYAQLLSEGYIESSPCRGYFACDVRDLYHLTGSDPFIAGTKSERQARERYHLPGDDPYTSESKLEKYTREQYHLTRSDPRSTGLKSEKQAREQAPLTDPGPFPGGSGQAFPMDRQEQKEWAADFSPNGIELSQFPFTPLGKIFRNLLLDKGETVLKSSSSFGDDNLRRAICSYLYRSRNVACEPKQIVLGAGNEYLQILLAQILGTDRRIAMESPTYLKAYRIFQNIGFPVTEISMDEDGMRADRLAESGADIAYVMPSHQFPLGIVMPMKRRLELLNWAAEKPDRYIIEDDYDSEFRYRGKPIPALQGMDRSGSVIYLGTFSKSIAPSLRLSYLVLPPQLLGACRERCGFYACTVPNLMQQAVYEFMQEGFFEKNLNRMRRIYRTKHDFFLGELKKRGWVGSIRGGNSGLHFVAGVRSSLPEEEITARCQEKGVRMYGLSRYFIGRAPDLSRPVFLFGYGGLTEEQMREGLSRIGEVLAVQ